MGNTILTDSDPVVQATLQYPDNVRAPSDGTYSQVYSASVTLKNTSHLPLQSSEVRITLDDDIMGCDAELWSDGAQRSIVSLNTGGLQPGAARTRPFKFRIKKSFLMVPPQSDRTMTFHVMPSYEINYQNFGGYVSQTRVVVEDRENLGGGLDWTVNPPNYNSQPNPPDPVIELKHEFFGELLSKTTGWNEGYTATPRIYVAASLQVTNKASVPLSFLRYQVAVDDDMSNYDVKCLGPSGPWGQAVISDDQGRLSPSGTTHPYNYWLAVFHIPGADMKPTTDNAQLQIAPWYKVEYQHEDSLNHAIPVAVS